ncbi:MAG TPA: GyrI-like domain-containing protein [Brevefilum sp.]
MEPQIVYKPAFTIVGIPHDGKSLERDMDALWDQLAKRYAELPHVDPDQGFGVHNFSDDGHNYLAGFAAYRDGVLPPGMVEQRIGENAYAVFIHRGSLASIPETMTRIFEGWLPGSGYQLASDYFFECYDDRFNPGSPDSVVFVFVPVRGAK